MACPTVCMRAVNPPPPHGTDGTGILLIAVTSQVKTWHWPWSPPMETAETSLFPLGFQMTDAHDLILVLL